jgi:hypothetical protein
MAGYAVGQQVAVGVWSLQNTGRYSVKITGITWPHIHGLRVISAWLAPILQDPKDGDWMEVGDGGSWPPAGDPTTDREWARSVPLIGAVIKPGRDPSKGPQVVLEIARTGASRGTTAGPLVTYTSNGHTYTVNEGSDLEIAAKC